MVNLCSLRQYDLDQVIRVERRSLLSVPHRGTPRSIVIPIVMLLPITVNLKIVRLLTCTERKYGVVAKERLLAMTFHRTRRRHSSFIWSSLGL